MGVDVRLYCPSVPEYQLYSNFTLYSPSCVYRDIGVCVDLERPVEVYSSNWLCRDRDRDVDVYVISGSPYGQVESEWISRCSRVEKPVAGYFVTESDIVPSLLAHWLLHVDAVGFTTRAVANAYLVHESVREIHGDWVLVPHGLPDYYYKFTSDAIIDCYFKLCEERGVKIREDPGVKLALESRSEGVLYGTVAKDHPRKDYGALLAAFSRVKHSCVSEKLPFCDKIRVFLGFIRAVGVPTWLINTIIQLLGLSSSDVLILDERLQESGISEFSLLFSYSLIDVFVFATMGEGFGLPPVEAGALFKPVVVTKTPVTEEIWGGDYPLLVKSRPIVVSEGFILHVTDYVDLARKMSRLISRRYARRAGLSARRVAEKYTSKRMAEAFLKLVELAREKRGVKKPHPLREYRASDSPDYREIVLKALKLI